MPANGNGALQSLAALIKSKFVDMNIWDLKQKSLWQMTGDDLLALMRHEWEEETVAEKALAVKQAEQKRYVYGIRGIAEIFNCSLPTANRIKKSGRIDRAITQVGRKIVVDTEMALELAGRKKFGGR